MTIIGDLCAGYGGLGMAAEQVTGGRTVWHVENDAAPSGILAHHHPGVRNFGDLKALEWAAHPVDVLTAGYPCQPFSHAGGRRGVEDERHLFPWIVLGVERMRPALLLLENVRGHLSLGFDLVLAELDRIGYDVRWTLLRAADVGACHGRSRLWIAARAREVGGWPVPAGEPTALIEGGCIRGPGALLWTDPASGLFGSIEARRPGTSGTMVRGLRWDRDATGVRVWHPPAPTSLATAYQRQVVQHKRNLDGLDLLPTPTSRDHKGPNQRQDDTCLHGALLPTPRATDGTKGGPNQRGSSGDLMLPSAVMDLLPTPAATDAKGARNSTSGRREDSQHHSGDTLGDLVFDGRLLPTPVAADGGGARASSAGWGLRDESRTIADSWGIYAAAIHRHEAAFGRTAPPPTEQGRNGPRLSPRFVEWMMMLPDGWVTGAPGITRNHALKVLGNGVVPMQAVAAYRLLGVSGLFCEVAA